MRFLVLIHEDAGAADAGPPPAPLIEAVQGFRADTTHGRWLDDGGLAPPAEAMWLRTRDGRRSVVDGPFAEAKEVVGGFFVVESESASAMTRWIEAFLDLHGTHWPALSFAAEVRRIAGPE